MKKILLTGSAGFIFSNFVRKVIYNKEPYKLVSVDRINSSSVLNNIYQNKNHSFYIGDITDQHFMNVIFEYERPDIVIHSAAETHVDNSLKDATKFMHTNVFGTQVVVDCCVKWGVEKLVYVSTDECFGHLTSESEPSWTEESPMNPRNPYSASKASGELIVKAAAHCHGLKYNITRASNNYGPRQTPDKLIPKIIKCILNDQPIPIYGQGLQMRDWTYVADNCDAVLTILNKGKDNEIYNISANQEFTNIEIVQQICNIMNKGHSLISYITDRKGHDFRYSINCDKLKGLGWKPNYKLKEGLPITIEWYLKNQYFVK